jgi:hypothetical protein
MSKMKDSNMKSEDDFSFDDDADDSYDDEYDDEDYFDDDSYDDVEEAGDELAEDVILAITEGYYDLSEEGDSMEHHDVPAKPEHKDDSNNGKSGIKDSINKQIKMINAKLSKLAPSSQSARALKEKRKKLRARLTLSK